MEKKRKWLIDISWMHIKISPEMKKEMGNPKNIDVSVDKRGVLIQPGIGETLYSVAGKAGIWDANIDVLGEIYDRFESLEWDGNKIWRCVKSGSGWLFPLEFSDAKRIKKV